jgi:flagellar biosynthetic protein FliR
MLDAALNFVPTFVLVVFRLGGMMLYAPLFGSARIPRRVRVMLALVLAMGITPGIKPVMALPDSPWELAVGIAGELLFGLAMGLVMSLVFVAVQWAGEIISQQLGFSLGGVIDPEYGGQSSVMGDLYFMFTLVIFLIIGGHHAMLRGVRASFDALPLLSLGINQNLFTTLIDLLQAGTVLAIQLAAPVLVTLLIVDLVLGLVGRTIPQMNVMSAALSIRAGLGLLIVWLGLNLTGNVIRKAVDRSMDQVRIGWTTGELPRPAPR